MAKGASPEEATRLANLKARQDQSTASQQQQSHTEQKFHRPDEDHDDDEELEEYRSKRIIQLQHGNVIPISRTEWNDEVNEASHHQWVVISLTSTSSAPNLNPYHLDMCRKVEQDIIPSLAGKFSEVKWVSIPSKSAIENWPDDNLPTLFCYRGGKLQCQLVGLGDFGVGGGGGGGGEMHVESVEFKLGKLGVLDSEIEVDPDQGRNKQGGGHRGNGGGISSSNSYGRSKFQGGMATYATNDEDLSDYDDVD